MTINATLTTKTNDNSNIHKYRKEKHFQESLQLIVANYSDYGGVSMRKIIDCRIYRTEARHYCCIWINDSSKGVHLSGAGMSQGYGYHRPSAAMQAALADARIKLDSDIDGRGDSAMEDALEGIARAMGYSDYLIVKAHG